MDDAQSRNSRLLFLLLLACPAVWPPSFPSLPAAPGQEGVQELPELPLQQGHGGAAEPSSTAWLEPAHSAGIPWDPELTFPLLGNPHRCLGSQELLVPCGWIPQKQQHSPVLRASAVVIRRIRAGSCKPGWLCQPAREGIAISRQYRSPPGPFQLLWLHTASKLEVAECVRCGVPR